jgi:hypothetical protein
MKAPKRKTVSRIALLDRYRRQEMAAAHERDGGICLRCGRPTSAQPHHFIKGSDRYRTHEGWKVDWRHRDFVGTLCGPLENNCHDWADKQSRIKIIEFVKAHNYGGKFSRLIALLEAWYPAEVE